MMPQVRFSTSALGAYLAPKISAFIKQNADAAAASSESSPEEGAEAIANAIVYGVALAWSSPMVQGAFAAGIAPPPVPPAVITAGSPVGILISNALKPQATEPT